MQTLFAEPEPLEEESTFRQTPIIVQQLKEADEDFEWYPTTDKMINAIRRKTYFAKSILDIGAGDGRVLVEFAKRPDDYEKPELYAIEKSGILLQEQPEEITPVGTEFIEQNLACLPVDLIFCNPPYSEYEQWAAKIIETGHARIALLVIPQRWKDSKLIKAAIEGRGARVTVIHSDDFHNADRKARAVIDIIEVRYPTDEDHWNEKTKDPFDIWFDQNVQWFEEVKEDETDYERNDVARMRKHDSIDSIVEAYNEEYARMEANYRTIFQMDRGILKELGVTRDHIRDGIKKKMAGLKNKYWELLFLELEAITKRLSTKTKKRFLERLTGSKSVAFTSTNCYAVVLWAIKHANKYFDEQCIDLFRKLSTHEGAMNYKSNQRTWQKDGWRYNAEDHSHYSLDYRIVLHHYQAIGGDRWNHPGGLHDSCHEVIDDIRAVMFNLGFAEISNIPSRTRTWDGGKWQDFHVIYKNDIHVLFQMKAFQNGNMHFRFMPDAIKALNVEAGRLLGWLRSKDDVVKQLGYTPEEANAYFGSSMRMLPSNVKLLTAS